MTFDAYIDGRLFARDLMLETVEDFCKIDSADIVWALAQDGRCSLLDDSGRALEIVGHGDDLTAKGAICNATPKSD